MNILNDFLRALAQLPEPKFRAVFFKSIALTLALLAAVGVAWYYAVGLIPATGITIFGAQMTWLDAAIDAVAWAAGAFAMFFLMIPVAALFIGLFLEDVADAVEARHYPQLPPAGRMSLMETALDGLRFAGVLIVANLFGLILYLLSGPLAPFVFIAVNGWLLGREYFELVAARRIGIRAARALRKRHALQIWAAGALMAAALALPLVGLLIPVLGVASFTHAFHRLMAAGARADAPRT